MSRGYLIIDIETIPDAELHWDAAKEGFPPPLYHQVVALGALWLNADLSFRRLGIFGALDGSPDNPPEAMVLEEFARFVGQARPHLVTYNGRCFDLPVLVNRCLRHGVPFGVYYADRDYRYRFSELGHLDLADLLTDFGAARRPRLDAVAKLIGAAGKLDVDGSMVETLYEQGRIEEIRTYCLHDVVQTAFVFLRCELLRGRISREVYASRSTELWEALCSDSRVAPLLESCKKDQLLLNLDRLGPPPPDRSSGEGGLQ